MYSLTIEYHGSETIPNLPIISPSILSQTCFSNITVRKGIKEEGAVASEPLYLHYWQDNI